MNEVCKVKGGLDKFRIHKDRASGFYRLFVRLVRCISFKRIFESVSMAKDARDATFKKLHVIFSAAKKYEMANDK